MYYGKYDLYPTDIRFAEAGFYIPPSTWKYITCASSLRLHADMAAAAELFRAPAVKHYALHKILDIFSKATVSVTDFVDTTKAVYKINTKRALLKQIFALYAAHLEELWQKSPEFWREYKKLAKVADFMEMMLDAKEERSRLMAMNGILPGTNFSEVAKHVVLSWEQPPKYSAPYMPDRVEDSAHDQSAPACQRIAFGSMSSPYNLGGP